MKRILFLLAAGFLLASACSNAPEDGNNVDFYGEVIVEDNSTLVLEKIINVTLPEAAPIAVACIRDDSPEEIHLVESTESTTSHVVRMQGLTGSTSYSCHIGPVDVGSPNPGTFTMSTSGLPGDIPSASAETSGSPVGEYALAPYQGDTEEELAIILLVFDNSGEVRWYYTLPVTGHADMGVEYYGDGKVLWGGVSASDPGPGEPQIVTISHDEIYQASYPGSGDAWYHHSLKLLDDGTVMALLQEDTMYGGEEWETFGIHRIDPVTDELVWSWNVSEAVQSGELYEDVLDYEGNWAGVMNYDGKETVVVSMPEDSTIFGLDPTSGDVDWILGDEGTLTLTGFPPQWQHGLSTKDNKVLVFDNGAQPTTRAVEYTIDAAAGTAVQSWYWTEPGWRDDCWGDVDFLDGDHILIASPGFGWDEEEKGAQIIEVSQTSDSVVWRLEFSGVEDSIYCADRIGGCDIFTDTSRCAPLADRLQALSEWLGM